METCVSDYQYLVRVWEKTEPAFTEVVAFHSATYQGRPDSPWKHLFDGARQLFDTYLKTDHLQHSIQLFSANQSPENTQNLCRNLEYALRQFTKEFTENRLAKPPEPWQAIRDYYAYDLETTPAHRRADLTHVHLALTSFLDQLTEVAQTMERSRRTLFPDVCDLDLSGLHAEMSYWSEYVGRWFNQIWSWIPQEENTTAQYAPRTQVTSAPPAHAGPPTAATVGPLPAQQASSTAPDLRPHEPALEPVPSPRLVAPQIKPARTRRGASWGRRIPVIRGLFRESASLGEDAEPIADAFKYNRMMILLLLRRIRKDTLSPDNSIEAFRNFVRMRAPWALNAYPPYVDAELQRLLDDATEAAEDFQDHEVLIRNGGNAGALLHAADQAGKCYGLLRKLAQHLDHSVPAAVSPIPAFRLKDVDAAPNRSAFHDDLVSISLEGQRTCAKVLKIIERINSIIEDHDFTRKHLAYQGIGRITGYEVWHDPVSPECMNTIEDAIRKVSARTKVR